MKDNGQFTTNFNDVNFYDSNGNKIDNIKDQLMDDKVIFNDLLQKDDIVKRRGEDIFYKIASLHYEIPGLGYFDYAGYLCDESGIVLDSKMCLFNQKDIENKVNVLKR